MAAFIGIQARKAAQAFRKAMETLNARDLVNARHDYTRGLLRCMPELDRADTILPTLNRDPAWLT